jgi:hypothetical protein
LKGVIGIGLFLLLWIPVGVAYPAEEKNIISRNQILREHHKLMHHMLMVMKDNVDLTEKILNGKITPTQRRTMKRRLTDLNTEVEGMIQKHESLMKSFEEMTEKREAVPERGAEEPAP